MINEDQAKDQSQNQNQDTRQLQIPEQQERLKHEMQKLYKSIEILASRLDPILRPSNPRVDTKSPDKPTEKQTLVILADAFRGLYKDAKNARFNIEDLIERLEL